MTTLVLGLIALFVAFVILSAALLLATWNEEQ